MLRINSVSFCQNLYWKGTGTLYSYIHILLLWSIPVSRGGVIATSPLRVRRTAAQWESWRTACSTNVCASRLGSNKVLEDSVLGKTLPGEKKQLTTAHPGQSRWAVFHSPDFFSLQALHIPIQQRTLCMKRSLRIVSTLLHQMKCRVIEWLLSFPCNFKWHWMSWGRHF
jgi:hypothetical protein